MVVIGDNDDAGRKHAQAVARSIRNVVASIKVVELPRLPDKGDVSDWLGNDGRASVLLTYAALPNIFPFDGATWIGNAAE